MENEKPTTIVIFGASGDLTRRKLIPALYRSRCNDRLPQNLNIVGFARRPWDHDYLRERLHSGMEEFASEDLIPEEWEAFSQRIWYSRGNLDVFEDYPTLNNFLREIEGGAANRLYYMATPPRFFIPIVQHLGKAGMVSEEEGWRRVVVEKPFGSDLSSAQKLNEALHQVFNEHQIFRIDHYLGKETAQNIYFLRFANTIFEPVWNRNYVDNIQITVAESVEVGHRAGYYDQAGVLRDMFQNHLLQLLALVAIEPPASFEANAVRNEKVKLLKSIRPVQLADTVRAQYEGYRHAERVDAQSQTATYAALKLYVDNWRWQGVPFYLRSGKGMARKNSEIIIEFREPPHLMFEHVKDEDFSANILSLCIQPDEGIHLQFEAKVPGSVQETRPVNLEFHYRSSFKGDSLPDAYERLLLDALNGDATLFTRSDGIETAWRLIDPVLEGWANTAAAPPLVTYETGSWGPDAADALLAKDGRVWRNGCGHH